MYSLDVEVLPPRRERDTGTSSAGAKSKHTIGPIFLEPRGEKIACRHEGKVIGTLESRMTARHRVRRRDFQFISGVNVWCPESLAKVTVLTMVDVDTGSVGVLTVSRKSPDNFMK